MTIDGDLLTREYRVQIEQDEIERSFMLEVVDDNVAENTEVFIIYTSVTEDPTDNCASTVLLRDNDGEIVITSEHNEVVLASDI